MVVVRRVLERQCQQSLLFEIRLMDARKTPGNDCHTAQKARRQGSVLAAAAFAIIMVTDYHPLNPLGLISPSNFGNCLPGFSGQNVLTLPGLTGERIGCTHEHVVAELVQMSP